MLVGKGWSLALACAAVALGALVLLDKDNVSNRALVAEVVPADVDSPDPIDVSPVTYKAPVTNVGTVLDAQNEQATVAYAEETVRGGASTDYGPFVDPADESTWKRLPDDAKRDFGPVIEAMDSNSRVDSNGVREYGLYVDPESSISRLNLDGKTVEFGRFVDPEDPYSWRRQIPTPVEYGEDTTQDFTNGI